MDESFVNTSSSPTDSTDTSLSVLGGRPGPRLTLGSLGISDCDFFCGVSDWDFRESLLSDIDVVLLRFVSNSNGLGSYSVMVRQVVSFILWHLHKRVITSVVHACANPPYVCALIRTTSVSISADKCVWHNIYDGFVPSIRLRFKELF